MGRKAFGFTYTRDIQRNNVWVKENVEDYRFLNFYDQNGRQAGAYNYSVNRGWFYGDHDSQLEAKARRRNAAKLAGITLGAVVLLAGSIVGTIFLAGALRSE